MNIWLVRILSVIFIGLLNISLAHAANPKVLITTNLGEIVVELEAEKTPKTVANFLQYVDDGFYNNTIFHRVINNFMIQGGGFTPAFERKKTRPPVFNEADLGIKNNRGTIAMARTIDPHSATAQFFINVKDNDFLDHKAKTPRGWGYVAFGRVVQGMNVVDQIKSTKTGAGGPFPKDVPSTPVIILSIARVENKSEAGNNKGKE